jgi:hypothetical protein|tara:strand:- start:616 stop:804 length:189 start_codon:yes stop_codon:yes gene_type:complete
MKGLRGIILKIGGVITFIIALTFILNFIGLEPELYLIYIVWLIVLLIFYIALPLNIGEGVFV